MTPDPALDRPIGWDHPDTARYYGRFQRNFARYRIANRMLAEHAALRPGMRVLDIAAGDGATTRAALECMNDDAYIVCFEPAAAMRALGQRTMMGRRATWVAVWPATPDSDPPFDRVLCGAAFWQLDPPAAALHRIHALLRPGGRFCFTVPCLYLGEPDAPGGGGDPHLFALPDALARERAATGRDATPGGTAIGRCENAPARPRPASGALPASATAVRELLVGTGFEVDEWRFRHRLTQAAYREWLKIPPTTDVLLRGLSADQRASLIDRAFERVDASSWRWERWVGWTARKRP